MAKRLTQEALALKLGVSQSMVARLGKRGMPTDSLAAARRWRAAHLDPLRGGKGGGPATGRGKGAPAGDLNTWKMRKTRAEATLLERKAQAGPQGVVEVAAMERALQRLFVSTQVHADSLLPKLLEGVTDALCPRTDPRYGATYAAIHGVLRNHWADGWTLQADAFVSEAPALRDVFLRMAAAHNGPGSRAGALLRGDA